MARVFAAFADGWGRVLRAPAILLGVFAVTWLVAFPAGRLLDQSDRAPALSRTDCVRRPRGRLRPDLHAHAPRRGPLRRRLARLPCRRDAAIRARWRRWPRHSSCGRSCSAASSTATPGGARSARRPSSARAACSSSVFCASASSPRPGTPCSSAWSIRWSSCRPIRWVTSGAPAGTAGRPARWCCPSMPPSSPWRHSGAP